MSENKGKDFEGLGELLDHNYDNIQELNNPLPGWWLLTFYGAIVFSFFYFMYYQVGPTLDDELKEAMSEIQVQASKQQGEGVDLRAIYENEDYRNKGKTSYILRCAACHGQNGEGLIGPNLADDFWIHGDGSLAAIQETVKKGVLDKGMPGWESQMSAEDLNATVIFIRTLRGTNPAASKSAQGEKHEPVL